MKSPLILMLMGATMFFSYSCRHNRLKTNEKELAEEILFSEKTKGVKEKNNLNNDPDNYGKKSSYGLRKKENRLPDPQNPPLRIDIPGTINSSRELQLSDVASEIKYVKLETPPDTILLYDHFFYRDELMSTIRSDDEQIIFQGLYGVIRYNMQGIYQETIWENKTGINFYGKMVSYGGNDFFGVPPHIPVDLINGDIYYEFHDGPAGTGQVMRYRPGTGKNMPVQSQAEMPGQQNIPGDTLITSGNFPIDQPERIFGIGTDSWAGINSKWNSGKSGTMLITYNNSGDTICKFTDYERIVDFTKSMYRSPVDLISYQSEGLLTIKPEYNDTVFRLIEPERLLPVYVISFGELTVSFRDGLDPDFDLSQKLMLKSLHETPNFLFIRYTQNNDSPDNVKKNAVRFYNVLFDKKWGKMLHQPGYSLLSKGIVNDIDGGMSFWPDFVTPQGEMMKLVSGKMFKDFINSDAFKITEISDENRRKQVSMASGLRNTDMIIMIVK
jgi:hypothetical protein